MTPALAVLAWHVDPTRVLNLSQVLLSFGIPFALIPLILVGRRRRLMGLSRYAVASLAVLIAIAGIVVTLNSYLVVHATLAA